MVGETLFLCGSFGAQEKTHTSTANILTSLPWQGWKPRIFLVWDNVLMAQMVGIGFVSVCFACFATITNLLARKQYMTFFYHAWTLTLTNTNQLIISKGLLNSFGFMKDSYANTCLMVNINVLYLNSFLSESLFWAAHSKGTPQTFACGVSPRRFCYCIIVKQMHSYSTFAG